MNRQHIFDAITRDGHRLEAAINALSSSIPDQYQRFARELASRSEDLEDKSGAFRAAGEAIENACASMNDLPSSIESILDSASMDEQPWYDAAAALDTYIETTNEVAEAVRHFGERLNDAIDALNEAQAAYHNASEVEL